MNDQHTTLLSNLNSKKEHTSENVKTLINTLAIDNRKNTLFLGTQLGLERYDTVKYPKLNKFYTNQLSMFWRPEEFLLDTDRNDFSDKLTDHGRKIFTQNIGFQIVLDTIQSTGIEYLLQFCTNSELARALKWWATFENLHSSSYTHIIQGVYPDPEVVFDNYLKDEEILKRVSGCVTYYDELLNSMGDTEHDLKKKIYLTLVSVQILESIRFYVSFACTYWFAEQKLMMNNAKIIALINRDENLHMALTKDIIDILKTNPSEGFVEIVKECEPIVEQMWKDAVNEEMDWADYLFEEGDLYGMNAEQMKQYMKFLVNQRMKLCGFGHLRFFEKVKNPFESWISSYQNQKDVQLANQETSGIAYTVNAQSARGMDDMDDLMGMME